MDQEYKKITKPGENERYYIATLSVVLPIELILYKGDFQLSNAILVQSLIEASDNCEIQVGIDGTIVWIST